MASSSDLTFTLRIPTEQRDDWVMLLSKLSTLTGRIVRVDSSTEIEPSTAKSVASNNASADLITSVSTENDCEELWNLVSVERGQSGDHLTLRLKEERCGPGQMAALMIKIQQLLSTFGRLKGFKDRPDLNQNLRVSGGVVRNEQVSVSFSDYRDALKVLQAYKSR